MRIREIRKVVEGTSDCAFAVNGGGQIVAWNRAAESVFGLSPAEAIGKMCCEVVRGVDECGAVCSTHCVVRQAVERNQPPKNFDFQVETPTGKQWCNLSLLVVQEDSSVLPYVIHIVRQTDVQKRLELLVRDFLITSAGLTVEQARALMTSAHAACREAKLSDREVEILHLLAQGYTTTCIADQLHISRTTVHNHIQHILGKLGCHTRLEAIRRAEHARLI